MIKAIFTCGDINGIGPEIVLKTFNRLLKKNSNFQILFICPKNIFQFYYKQTKSTFKFTILKNGASQKTGINLLELPSVKIDFGKATRISGMVSITSIYKALEIIKSGQSDILVTAPVSKTAFNLAGISFPGHTELFADYESCKNYLMVFLSNKLKAGLFTIHKPISEISNLIKRDALKKSLHILNNSCRKDFGLNTPSIAVLGLNPHAGENGLIGLEEEKIIKPVINELKKIINVNGPFVPDAFWGNRMYEKFDIIFGMYHDQLLIPFKLLTYHTGVNFTAGLNLIRTSPDHGTAYDIAGKNLADESSFYNAYRFAIKIHKNRKKFIAKNISI